MISMTGDFAVSVEDLYDKPGRQEQVHDKRYLQAKSNRDADWTVERE
jgi:hypothetical protein